MSEIKTKFNLGDHVWYVQDYAIEDTRPNKDGVLEYKYYLEQLLITGIKIDNRKGIIYESEGSGRLLAENDRWGFISYDKQECIDYIKKKYEEYIQKEIEEYSEYVELLKAGKIKGVKTR